MQPTTLIAIEEIFQDFTRPGSPGCSLAVIQHGDLLCQRSYGLSDLENNLPLRPASVFNLGSVSKQFTACAILLLAQARKLTLDDEVHQHLPEFPDYGMVLTLRHLLHHTSGLRDTFPGLLALAEWRESDLTTFADVKRLLLAQRALNFHPGAEFQYANSNYILLAEICQRVSGQQFAALCREQIFKPLGMTSATIHASSTMLIPGRAQGYYADDDGNWLNAPLNDTVLGATNLYASILDLMRWERNFVTAQVGGPELIRQMTTPGRLNNGSYLDYAAGLAVGSQHRGWNMIEHGGSQGGYAVHFLRFPELELAVIILFNHFRWDTLTQALRVADLFMADKPGWSAPSPSSRPDNLIAPQVTGPNETHTGLQMSTDSSQNLDLSQYTGAYYASELDLFWRVTAEAGYLTITRRKYPATHPVLISPDTFRDDWEPLLYFPAEFMLEFDRNPQGQVSGFHVSGLGVRGLVFTKQIGESYNHRTLA